ncbi:hypothetical protein K1719_008870 [Acacia pycnantha]|nr:hypothetical protein K1719_008870 [Acacia pycnantha]
MRPSIDEVLEILREIESGKEEGGDREEWREATSGKGDEEVENLEGGDKPPPSSPPSSSISPEKEDVGFLKKVNPPPPSPNTVTNKWTSESSTPNASG